MGVEEMMVQEEIHGQLPAGMGVARGKITHTHNTVDKVGSKQSHSGVTCMQ